MTASRDRAATVSRTQLLSLPPTIPVRGMAIAARIKPHTSPRTGLVIYT